MELFSYYNIFVIHEVHGVFKPLVVFSEIEEFPFLTW